MPFASACRNRRPLALGAVFTALLLTGFAALRPVPGKSGEDEDAPLPPEEAAQSMVVPDGFEVTLFAGEPDVRQPIGFCIDDRGRLWVAEAYNYPHHSTEPGRDRIVIFEDTDGDGRHDERTVFYDGLNYVTGIEVGFGGAWVMSPPYFYFIPDRDRDDVPDAGPQLLLDGFGNHANAHNLANGFAWGPDGWLYGTHGRTNWSLPGKPGTPDDERTRFDGGVWRYHPTRHVWEPYADGTTNPWGIDWDDYGQAFVCNCVNPHLFHVIPGAHYEPWRNRRSSRFAYERIPTIADHLHFTGGGDVRAGIGSEAEHDAGGGHAHCGTMVYLGDNWPARYRNTLFTNNIHGRRINNDLLKRSGSGYVASHGPDLMLSRDTWYMGVTLRYGPGGVVYASDWSDTGECHSVRNTRRHTGRIYRIAYGSPQVPQVDLAKLDLDELVDLQSHPNDWFVRHARRVLQERAAAGEDLSRVHARLHALFAAPTDDNAPGPAIRVPLRALWALHVTGGLTDDFLVRQLDHASEHVRAWAVRLLCEDRKPPAAALKRFRELAAAGSSQLVRLHLASVLQRLSAGVRWPIVEALAKRSEDATDPNLPLMLWYAAEPLVHVDRSRFAQLAGKTEIPLLRRHAARRIAEASPRPEELDELVALLGKVEAPATQRDLLDGLLRGLEGRRGLTPPESWPATYTKLQTASDDETARQVAERAVRLALLFDDDRAKRRLQAQALDASEPAVARNRALTALVEARIEDFAEPLLELVSDPETRVAAVRGLARYDHPETAATILKHYASMDATAKRAAVSTLAARKKWASRLLDAVENETVDPSDLSAFTARQLQSLGDETITRRLRELWGEVRSTPGQRQKQIARLRKRLDEETLASADRSAGRAIFEKTCAKCHRLFDHGGKIGPDITGAQRRNLDYVLQNLVDPSAAVSRDYQMQTLVTTSGRVLTGLVVAETDAALTLQTTEERLVVPVDEIEERKRSTKSMMPDGMLDNLAFEQIRDLVAYLRSPFQVELPPGVAPAGDEPPSN